MQTREKDEEKTKKTHGDYERLLEELMEETRRLLLEARKQKKKTKKVEAKEKLFDQFIYINSLKNTATTMEGYKEAYQILEGSIRKFRNQIS